MTSMVVPQSMPAIGCVPKCWSIGGSTQKIIAPLTEKCRGSEQAPFDALPGRGRLLSMYLLGPGAPKVHGQVASRMWGSDGRGGRGRLAWSDVPVCHQEGPPDHLGIYSLQQAGISITSRVLTTRNNDQNLA